MSALYVPPYFSLRSLPFFKLFIYMFVTFPVTWASPRRGHFKRIIDGIRGSVGIQVFGFIVYVY